MPSHFFLTSSVKNSDPFSGTKLRSGTNVLICWETFHYVSRVDFMRQAPLEHEAGAMMLTLRREPRYVTIAFEMAILFLLVTPFDEKAEDHK